MQRLLSEAANLCRHGLGHIPVIAVPRRPGRQRPVRKVQQTYANAAGACASMTDRVLLLTGVEFTFSTRCQLSR